MNKLPLKDVANYIEPGPILLISTQDPETNLPNVMTAGFQMMVRHEPPTMAFVMGPWDYSQKALLATGECVVSVPGADLVQAVVDIGNMSGEDIEKYGKCGLQREQASQVAPPLISDCIANFECKVVNKSMVKEHGMFIVEVVAAWVKRGLTAPMIHHKGNGVFSVDRDDDIDLHLHMTKWNPELKKSKK